MGALCRPAQSSPLLHCEVTYGGTTDVIETGPVPDPYPVPSTDIGGRFAFKAVMVGNGAGVDYIKLYAYFNTQRQPVLIQEAKYLPPFPAFATPVDLTGEQHLYAGPAERELVYRCTFQGARP
jgi:hypothetical protein